MVPNRRAPFPPGVCGPSFSVSMHARSPLSPLAPKTPPPRSEQIQQTTPASFRLPAPTLKTKPEFNLPLFSQPRAFHQSLFLSSSYLPGKSKAKVPSQIHLPLKYTSLSLRHSRKGPIKIKQNLFCHLADCPDELLSLYEKDFLTNLFYSEKMFLEWVKISD